MLVGIYMYLCTLVGIARCLQEHSWVSEKPFEVMGVTAGDSLMATEAPRKGRENVANKVSGSQIPI